MSLDFNTLEDQKREVKSDEFNVSIFKPQIVKVYIWILLICCTLMSLASIILSLFSIENIPEAKPISIQCDSDLLKKIEKQAEILEEIAQSTKVGK